jgi:hypothetical protein
MGMNAANCHCNYLREGAASKAIQKSEDLLEPYNVFSWLKRHDLI